MKKCLACIVLSNLCLISFFGQRKVIPVVEELGNYSVEGKESFFRYDLSKEDIWEPFGPFITPEGNFLFKTNYSDSNGNYDLKITKGTVKFLSNCFEMGPKYYRKDFNICQRGFINGTRKFVDDDLIPLVEDESEYINPQNNEVRPIVINVNKYGGYLRTGHCIWYKTYTRYTGKTAEEKHCDILVITDKKGNVEIQMDFAFSLGKDGNRKDLIQYTTGNWGEIYCLIPPEPEIRMGKGFGGGGPEPQPFYDKGEARLVAVRNHLKEFGLLNESRVRLRSGPTVNSEIVGTFEKNTGFRILEKGKDVVEAGGIKDVWYKVRLTDGTEGYFFGAYVDCLYDGPGTSLPWPNVPWEEM